MLSWRALLLVTLLYDRDAVRILLATFSTPETFLENLGVDEDDATTLAVKTRARYSDQENIILEIGFPGLPNRVLLRTTAFTPAREQGDFQWFRLDPSEEAQRDFLIAVAAGRANASWTRRHRRFPVRIAARYTVEGESGATGETIEHEAATEDMAAGGIALETTETLPDGARVTVMLEPGDGSGSIEFTGKVVWNRGKEGEASESAERPKFSIGVQFDKPGGESMKRLRQLLRGVKITGKTFE